MPQLRTDLKTTDFREGMSIRKDINGKSIVFTMVNGKIFAMDSVCSHEGGPLEDGSLDNYNLTCPWHQGISDIRNAKASPATKWVTDLHSYAVIVEEKTGEFQAIQTLYLLINILKWPKLKKIQSRKTTHYHWFNRITCPKVHWN